MQKLNLKEIEEKAKAAKEMVENDAVHSYEVIHYLKAVPPETILKMISIIRKQQEALGVLSDVYVCDCKEAIKIYRQSGPRAWCCECSNYIRNEDDATFYERVEKARQTLTEVNEVMG